MSPIEWPETPEDPIPPALAPLIEAGEGESEGFELAESDLIEHASHGDGHGTGKIGRDAFGFHEEEYSEAAYGEADEEEKPDA